MKPWLHIGRWLVGCTWIGLASFSGLASDPSAHWAFQPVQAPVPPPNQDSWSRTDVDRFIVAGLRDQRLTPSPRAGKRTLIRRATFDLIGLPPSPEEVRAFLDDQTPQAFDRVLDRLLESPRYGERWARHWLDVVRYADTAGETGDFPVREAYRYRDYVIDSFNDDKPYDQFVREQVAGDILASMNTGDRYAEQVIATGYLAQARRFGFDSENYFHLTIEDIIDNLGKTFQGLTLACARCHDHKFDPVSMQDYYGLYGIFESTRFAHPGSESRKTPQDFPGLLAPSQMENLRQAKSQQMASLEARRQTLDEEKAALNKSMETMVPKNLKLLDQAVPDADGHAGFQVWRDPSGLPSVGINTSEQVLKVPGTVPPGALVLHPPASGAVVVAWRSPGQLSADLEVRLADQHDCGDSIGWALDHMTDDQTLRLAQGKLTRNQASVLDSLPSVSMEAGDVLQLVVTPNEHYGCDLTSVEWIISDPSQSEQEWNLARDIMHDPLSANPHADSMGHDWVWFLYQLPDGEKAPLSLRKTMFHPPVDEAGYRTTLQRVREVEKEWQFVRHEMDRINQEFTVEVAYAVAEGEAKDTFIQERGDPKVPAGTAARGWLKVLGGDKVKDGAGSGRLQLAEWLTRESNPLTARVMINRIWQHHFGRGLVATVNDFGTRGTPPTHPDLLDYLAHRFIKSGWSMKAMHRLIMGSAVYQADSKTAQVGMDVDNRWYGRYQAWRLDAESLRDSWLWLGGNLDLSPAGAHPFPPVDTWSFTQHNPFIAVYENNRRTIYQMQQRIKRHPFLGLFDGADPNVCTGRRFETTVPTQALYLMNSKFVHAQSQSLAGRILGLRLGETDGIEQAFEWVLGRKPNGQEVSRMKRFLREYRQGINAGQDAELPSWAALMRTLLIRNEFLFVP